MLTQTFASPNEISTIIVIRYPMSRIASDSFSSPILYVIRYIFVISYTYMVSRNSSFAKETRVEMARCLIVRS